MAAIFGVCFDVLHYVRLAAYVSRNIILLLGWLYGTWYIKNDENQRFSYVNERNFGFMLITY